MNLFLVKGFSREKYHIDAEIALFWLAFTKVNVLNLPREALSAINKSTRKRIDSEAKYGL